VANWCTWYRRPVQNTRRVLGQHTVGPSELCLIELVSRVAASPVGLPTPSFSDTGHATCHHPFGPELPQASADPPIGLTMTGDGRGVACGNGVTRPTAKSFSHRRGLARCGLPYLVRTALADTPPSALPGVDAADATRRGAAV
jgi:hypothetical protein